MGKEVVGDKLIGLGDVTARLRVFRLFQDGGATDKKTITLSFTDPDWCAEGYPYRPGQYIEVTGKDLKKLRDFLNENLPKDEGEEGLPNYAIQDFKKCPYCGGDLTASTSKFLGKKEDKIEEEKSKEEKNDED